MRGLRRWHEGLTLQKRLFSTYVCLVLAQLFLFGIVYYKVASDSILNIAKDNVLNTTMKNLQLAEERLNSIEERAEWVSEDQDVKEAVERMKDAKESEVLALDSMVSNVLNKYFYDENIVSAYLITPEYVLGNNAQTRVPVSRFYQSGIYRQILKQEEKGLWVPTYSAEEEYRLDWAVEQPAVFTYLYRLDSAEPPSLKHGQVFQNILLVNLKTDLFREIFEEEDRDGDSVYCVSDREGRIIVHTDAGVEGKAEELPWLGQQSEEGAMLADYQGQKSVVCYGALRRVGWVAAVIYPVSGLLENVGRMQYFTYGFAGLLFALALILATFFARRITRPIESLTAAMKRAEEGDFSERIPVNGSDEMQYLVSRYNEMETRIEKLIEENYKSEIRNKESEIMALNLQMNPHFLYNTLNIINLMALEEGELEISRMIISVSDMLQYTFRNKKEMVRLEDELEWLKNYTYIMEQRFEGKFQVMYQIEEGLAEYAVPKLLLEPLVENAIIHGFRRMESGGKLSISCKLEGDLIRFRIADNGQGISGERLQAALDGSAKRTGILNVKKRLELIYGEEAAFGVESEEGKGCTIFIDLPCRS